MGIFLRADRDAQFAGHAENAANESADWKIPENISSESCCVACYGAALMTMPCKLSEYKYPKGVLLRRVDNRGAISWHKTRIFISEVFRFEELAFELVTPDFYKVFFRDMEIGELNVEKLRFRAARRVV